MKFAKLKFALPILAVFVISCGATVLFRLGPELTRPKHLDPAFQLPSPLELASLPTAERFDFPLGSERTAVNLRICTLKRASSARHSSARVIAQTRAVG